MARHDLASSSLRAGGRRYSCEHPVFAPGVTTHTGSVSVSKVSVGSRGLSPNRKPHCDLHPSSGWPVLVGRSCLRKCFLPRWSGGTGCRKPADILSSGNLQVAIRLPTSGSEGARGLREGIGPAVQIRMTAWTTIRVARSMSRALGGRILPLSPVSREILLRG
jgi:hypothetical protein